MDMEVELSTSSIESEVEVELMVPPIICKEEEEEDMTTNLRVEYKERQHKRLSKSITIVPPPTKKPCMEILGLKPVSAIASTLEPSAAAAAGNPALD